jgi:peptidyl-prolyl cis-trans isomerase B (cyclophilin B)
MAHSVAVGLDSGEEQTSEEDTGVPTTKQRRATAKRKLERQLERRAQQARRRRMVTIAAAVVIVAVVAGLAVWQFVFRTDTHSTSTASSSTSSAAPTTPPAEAGVLPAFKAPADLGANCQYPATPNEPASKKVNPPRTGKIPTDPPNVSMSITTNQGPFGVQLDNAKAPCTVNNFASLAGQNYFNDTHCHRLVTGANGALLQCGDPTSDGSGGPGYQFANEYPTNQYAPTDPALSQPVVYPRGTLAMANKGPNTNGSQFFIVIQPTKLGPNYTVFGKVDDRDMGLFDKIAAAGTVDGSLDGKPKTDVIITSARLD